MIYMDNGLSMIIYDYLLLIKLVSESDLPDVPMPER